MSPTSPETITSRRNPRVLSLKALHQGAGRSQQGLYLVEGVRVLEAALAAAAPLAEAWVSPRLQRQPRGQELRRRLLDAGVPLIEASDAVLEAITATRTHQGVAATCRPWPEVGLPGGLPAGDVLVLADLQDPGNLGTLWRTAAAAGFGSLWQGAAGVDPYGPKVVRSATGAAFRVPAYRAPLDEGRLEELRRAGFQLVGTCGGGAARYDVVAWGERVALLVGQEGPGLPDSWLDLCDETVRIPMAPGVESLNAGVSAALLMYERARRAGFGTMHPHGGTPGESGP